MTKQIDELIQGIKSFANRGWCPATSTNFSLRNSKEIIITRSGFHKENTTPDDLIPIDLSGTPQKTEDKPSAETLIHCALYKMFPEVNCVLHTHSPHSTVLSLKMQPEGLLRLQGYELLKAFEGFETHDDELLLPIFPNSQNMSEFSQLIENRLVEYDRPPGFLMAGHGLYSWGKDVFSATRSLEALEFLIECELLKARQ